MFDLLEMLWVIGLFTLYWFKEELVLVWILGFDLNENWVIDFIVLDGDFVFIVIWVKERLFFEDWFVVVIVNWLREDSFGNLERKLELDLIFWFEVWFFFIFDRRERFLRVDILVKVGGWIGDWFFESFIWRERVRNCFFDWGNLVDFVWIFVFFGEVVYWEIWESFFVERGLDFWFGVFV